MDNLVICRAAIKQFGEQHQLMKCVEECGELIQAISKYSTANTPETKANLLEEIADVYLTMKQVQLIAGFSIVDVSDKINTKAIKLAGYLNVVE